MVLMVTQGTDPFFGHCRMSSKERTMRYSVLKYFKIYPVIHAFTSYNSF